MLDGYAYVWKTFAKPSYGLGSQRNFWNEHDTATAFVDHPAERTQIDFGLATARHAVKQDWCCWFARAVVERGVDDVECCLLIVVELQCIRGSAVVLCRIGHCRRVHEASKRVEALADNFHEATFREFAECVGARIRLSE